MQATFTNYSSVPYGHSVFSPNVGLAPDLGMKDVLQIERPTSFARKFLEFLLYLQFINSALLVRTGLANLPFAGGGVVLVSGAVCVMMMLARRERIPTSLWFFGVMYLGANLAIVFLGETPVFGDSVRPMLTAFCQLAMFCYLIQNEKARRRIELFFVLLLIVLVVTAGGFNVITHTQRLKLEYEEVGTVFSNTNRLASMAGFFAVALLFRSLRSSKLLRPVLWFLSTVLVYFLVQTVSRGGTLALVCGLAMLLMTFLLGRGMRIGGVIMIAVGFVVVWQIGFMFAGWIGELEERLRLEGTGHERYAVWTSWATVGDIGETLLIGRGSAGRNATAVGIPAHNTFLNTHFHFGGLAAYPYLFWIMWLWIRVFKLLLSKDYSIPIRFEVAALFGMAYLFVFLENSGWVMPNFFFAIALIEKYTACYSRRARAQRRAATAQPVQYFHPEYSRPSYA